MEFTHNNCGGRIDTGKRTCLRCKRHWNILAFQFNTSITMIQPTRGERERIRKMKVSDTPKWADRLPGVGAVANFLPNWPRWARLLSTCLVIAGIVFLVLWLTSCTPYEEEKESGSYSIEVIDSNLLAVVADPSWNTSNRFLEALREISETYIILDTTAVTGEHTTGRLTTTLLVQVESK